MPAGALHSPADTHSNYPDISQVMENRLARHIASYLALIPLFVLGGCSLGGDRHPQAAMAADEPRMVELFYVTDRAPDADGDEYFSGIRGDLSYGVAEINIPPGHIMGEHEEASLLKLEWENEAGKHIKLHDVLTLNSNTFTARLGRAIEASAGNRVMVFVHGYNEPFPETSKRVAQFADDVKFTGPVILFTWPSQGSLTGYVTDETNAEWAESHFIEMLTMLLEQVPAHSIYLVGHSMGNRIIGNAMVTLSGDRLESDLIRFREIIMIAPDIDADVFRREMAPRLARTGIHISLYASSRDRALMASKAFHGYPRAGDSGESLVIVDGMETIDASETSGGLLGHSYYAEDRRIMEDIYGLLQTGQRADDRFGLQAMETAEGRYWTFRK
jgi:esterase/lipase superfamily enzyme